MNEMFYNIEDERPADGGLSAGCPFEIASDKAEEPKEIDGIEINGRYNAKQAAALINISRTSFFSVVKSGKIKRRYTKISSRPYYLGRDLLRLINRI